MTKKKDSKPYVGWPLDRLALGERLWGDGYKAGFCAEQCGVTRNAFLGMAHRKRWPRGVAVEPEEKPVKAQAKGKPRVAKPELPREIPPAEVGKVRLLDLGFYSCRWPVSGVGMSTLFCGKRSAGSYCEEHQKVSAGVRYGGNDRR
jgi:hypothetical protein